MQSSLVPSQRQLVVSSTFKHTASVREEENKVVSHLFSMLTFDVHPELSRQGLDSGEAGQASPPKAASRVGWKKRSSIPFPQLVALHVLQSLQSPLQLANYIETDSFLRINTLNHSNTVDNRNQPAPSCQPLMVDRPLATLYFPIRQRILPVVTGIVS